MRLLHIPTATEYNWIDERHFHLKQDPNTPICVGVQYCWYSGGGEKSICTHPLYQFVIVEEKE